VQRTHSFESHRNSTPPFVPMKLLRVLLLGLAGVATAASDRQGYVDERDVAPLGRSSSPREPAPHKRAAPLTCKQIFGVGSIQCGNSTSFCFNPTQGQTCCTDGGFCNAGSICAPVGGYCCPVGMSTSDCAKQAGFNLTTTITGTSTSGTSNIGGPLSGKNSTNAGANSTITHVNQATRMGQASIYSGALLSLLAISAALL